MLKVPVKSAKIPSISRRHQPGPGQLRQRRRSVRPSRRHAAVPYPRGSGSYVACVIDRESGGNSRVMNSGGRYVPCQFSESAREAYGGSASDFSYGSVAGQNPGFKQCDRGRRRVQLVAQRRLLIVATQPDSAVVSHRGVRLAFGASGVSRPWLNASATAAAVADAELGVDVQQVGLDRGLADEQPGGRLAVGDVGCTISRTSSFRWLSGPAPGVRNRFISRAAAAPSAASPSTSNSGSRANMLLWGAGPRTWKSGSRRSTMVGASRVEGHRWRMRLWPPTRPVATVEGPGQRGPPSISCATRACRWPHRTTRSSAVRHGRPRVVCVAAS
jgi:hypothetical protein